MPKKNKPEKDAIDQIVDQLDLQGVTQEELFGEGGLVKIATAKILYKALDAAMDVHLGYPKHSSSGDSSGNSRNGYSSKKVLAAD